MKKFLSILFSLSLALSVFSINVSASEVTTPITNEIRTVSLESTSAEFQAVLAESGAEIHADTQLQLVPLSTKTGMYSVGQALVITNQSGATVTKDVIIPMGDSTVGFLSDEWQSTIDYTDDDIGVGWNEKIIICGSASFIKYKKAVGPGTYYRPLSAAFSYQKEDVEDDVSVRYIDMRYTCDGYLYTWPDYEMAGPYEFAYTIQVYAYEPEELTEYSEYSPIPDDRVIGKAGAFAGNHMTFDTEINGRYDGITVQIFDDYM